MTSRVGYGEVAIPQYDFEKITSASFCQNCATDAAGLAKESHDLIVKEEERFSYMKTFFALEMSALFLLAYSAQANYGASSILMTSVATGGVAMALFITLGLMIYTTYSQKKLLDRAQIFEGISLEAKTRAAELPTWNDPSVGLLRSLFNRLCSGANDETSLKTTGVERWTDFPVAEEKILKAAPYIVAAVVTPLIVEAIWKSLPLEITTTLRERFVNGSLQLLRGGK